MERWAWGVAIACALTFVVADSLPVWANSRRSSQTGLEVREDSGYLRITWSPASIGKGATLEILDGKDRTTVAVPPDLTSATFKPRTSDVEIRLYVDARFVHPVLERPEPDLRALEAEAENLTGEAAIQKRRIAELERVVAKIGPIRY